LVIGWLARCSFVVLSSMAETTAPYTKEDGALWSPLVVQQALEQGILSETAPKGFIYHLDELEATWKQLFDAFPKNTLHSK
jgi:hypothetical protein